jgi:hypothetical protein
MKEGKMHVRAPKFQLPAKIAGVAVDYKQQIATVTQAMTVLDAARNIRGENAGERGAIARTSYMPVMVNSESAEVSYYVTDLRPIKCEAKMRLLFDKTAVTKLKEVLVALKHLGYAGTLIINSDIPVTSYLVKEGSELIFKGAQFSVVSDSYYDMSLAKEIPLLDFRQVGHKRNTVLDTITEYTRALNSRMRELKGIATRFVLHGPMLEHEEKVLFYPSCRAHNLMGYYVFKMETNNALYTADHLNNLYFASLVANVARTIKPIVMMPLHLILERFNLKCPVTPPEVIIGVAGDELEEGFSVDFGSVGLEVGLDGNVQQKGKTGGQDEEEIIDISLDGM